MENQNNGHKRENLEEKSLELDFLFEVDSILNLHEKSIKENLQSLVCLIPKAFQYASICAVQLEYEDHILQSEGFESTDLKIFSPITVDGTQKGKLTVVYLKPIRNDKGIFLPKELQLLNTIAQKIGSYILYSNLRDTIRLLQEEKDDKSDTLGAEENLKQWLGSHFLTEDEINQFLKVKIHFSKGETLCKQGSMASYVILLSEGLAKNFVEGNQEKGFNFKIIKSFDFIGLSALYNNPVFAFSGSALTECTAYLIDSSLFKNVIQTNQRFANVVMGWYCDTTQSHLARMSSIANKQSLGRLAEVLLYLWRDIYDHGPIESMSRKEIAALAAMSMESAVRFMSDLKKDGILRMNTNRIYIDKPEVLEMISKS